MTLRAYGVSSVLILVSAFLLTGCPSTSEKKEVEKAPQTRLVPKDQKIATDD